MGAVTPSLVLDLAVVRDRYRALTAALPAARVLYAVKANPAPEVLATLAALGCGFDVAGPAEAALALAAGATRRLLSHGNPVRKASEVAAAFAFGVREFVTDSREDMAVLAAAAPGAAVLVRITVDETGSATPFGGKFGCSPATAVSLLRAAPTLGLVPGGVAFHVGSQQRDPQAWARGIAAAAEVAGEVPVPVLDLGGGFPVAYDTPVPPLTAVADAVAVALDRHFPGAHPELVVEPGRFLVAEAGLLRSEVVRVSHRDDGRRWVYLDVGRYGGLAETEGEAIRYRITAPRGGPAAPAVLAGPTCDGDDVLYRHVELPADLRAGDVVTLHAAGAYTASYASVGFNGLLPLPVACVDGATPGCAAAALDGAA